MFLEQVDDCRIIVGLVQDGPYLLTYRRRRAHQGLGIAIGRHLSIYYPFWIDEAGDEPASCRMSDPRTDAVP